MPLADNAWASRLSSAGELWGAMRGGTYPRGERVNHMHMVTSVDEDGFAGSACKTKTKIKAKHQARYARRTA